MAAEPGIYTGDPEVIRNTTLLTHTAEDYMPKFREVVFYSTNLLRAFGLAAFGKPAMVGNKSFGDVTKSSGKGIIFNDGGYQFSFALMKEGPSASYVDRLGNITPQYTDPGTGGAYSWCRGVIPVYIPEEFVLDNVGNARLLNRFTTEMKLAKSAAIREVTYGLTGHSSAASGSPGDSTRNLGLNRLVSVTQTGTIGDVNRSNSYWQNALVASTGVGGGGDLDRPLQFLRELDKTMIATRAEWGQ